MTDLSKLKSLPAGGFKSGTFGPPEQHYLNELRKVPQAIEEAGSGKELLGSSKINNQTGTSYTFTLEDAGSIVEFENGSAVTVTIPPNSDIPFEYPEQDGNAARIDLVQAGAGTVTVQGGSGVTLRSADSATDLRTQWAAATLYQRAKDEWVLAGEIA